MLNFSFIDSYSQIEKENENESKFKAMLGIFFLLISLNQILSLCGYAAIAIMFKWK